MASDPKRLEQVIQHIRRIKAGEYPIIQGDSARGDYKIVERPFAELAEPSKLFILQEAVNWSGISNRDQAHILLAEIDPGRITDAQRQRLIEAAAGQRSSEEMLQEAATRTGRSTGKDRSLER